MGNYRQCLALAVFFDQPFFVFLSRFILSTEELCRLTEGPFEMGVADVLAT